MPASLVRLSINALIATTADPPDIDSATTSGLNPNGYHTPEASRNAISLIPTAHHRFWFIVRTVACGRVILVRHVQALGPTVPSHQHQVFYKFAHICFDVLRTTRNVSHNARPYPIAASTGMPARRGPMLCCMSKEAAM